MTGSAGSPSPPPLARRLLRRVLRRADSSATEGDLAELFAQRAAKRGAGAARSWYWRQVMGFVWRSRAAARASNPETAREGVLMMWLADLGADVRVAIRALRKRPSFAVVAILTLALGIGANSAVFTLVNAHFLTPLPYDRPDEIVLLWETARHSYELDPANVTTVAPGNYYSWREDARSFDDIAAFNVAQATLSGDGVAEQVTASVVSPNFFEVLGVSPLLGIGFSQASTRSDAGEVVLLSHSLWTRRFGSDPAIVGSTVRVNGRPRTVLGIMASSFRQPERSLSWQRVEVWFPMDLESRRDDHGSRYLRTVARLSEGVSVAEAREEMALVGARLAEAFPEDNTGRGVLVFTLDEYLLADARPTLLILLIAGAAVLLVVCANVANLTLARGQSRRQEFAVRAALGSGRLRLLRQVLVEGLLLALAGGALGVGIIFLGRGLLQAVQQRFFSGLVDVTTSVGVVLFTVALAAVAGILFGLPLARSASNPELRDALVEGGSRAGDGPSSGVTRNLLVSGQVALATALVVIAALLARSFDKLVSTPPGFDASAAVAFSLSPTSTAYPDLEALERYYRDIWQQVEAVPTVARVGLVSDMPFTTENRWTTVQLPGGSTNDAEQPSVEFRVAFPEYFEVMGIPVVAGRLFDDGWTPLPDVPAVVNRRMASALWPDRDPLGETLILDWSEPLNLRVVGVVDNELDDGFAAAPEPILYLPYFAQPQRGVWVVARTEGPPAAAIDGIRRAVAAVDPDVPAADLRPLAGMLAETVARPRAASLIGAVFAVIALLVAAAGIYGVLSYSVQSRTREFGIRAALGASDSQLVSMVLGQSTRLVVLGLVLGLTLAVGAGAALSGLLFGVRAWDPPSLVLAAALLAGVGTLAAWLPTRKAVRIDPRQALGTE